MDCEKLRNIGECRVSKLLVTVTFAPFSQARETVGVRNSDHTLDLRIRSGRRRRASDSKKAREASVRHCDSLSLAAELPECGAVPCRT